MVATLAADVQLLFLCEHGTRHAWKRFFWLQDVAPTCRGRRWARHPGPARPGRPPGPVRAWPGSGTPGCASLAGSGRQGRRGPATGPQAVPRLAISRRGFGVLAGPSPLPALDDDPAARQGALSPRYPRAARIRDASRNPPLVPVGQTVETVEAAEIGAGPGRRSPRCTLPHRYQLSSRACRPPQPPPWASSSPAGGPSPPVGW